LSLVLANGGASAAWVGLWEQHYGPAALGLHLSLREWVNEGLMAVFFFVVGVDIKKEFVYGSLASVRKAILPCLGALGGMVVPMAVYTLFNLSTRAGASAAGWAVPMATDIAFAMGVFGFFKSRMPPGAQAFLLTLATVDDLGAIAVIAVLCVCRSAPCAAPARCGARPRVRQRSSAGSGASSAQRARTACAARH
jgi:NhaA family Na+:H+ antiporter